MAKPALCQPPPIPMDRSVTVQHGRLGRNKYTGFVESSQVVILHEILVIVQEEKNSTENALSPPLISLILDNDTSLNL